MFVGGRLVAEPSVAPVPVLCRAGAFLYPKVELWLWLRIRMRVPVLRVLCRV